MENVKNIFLFFGSAAGVYSFIRLVGHDISSFFNKSKLIIQFDPKEDLKPWRVGPPYLENMVTRKVATVHIRNKGEKPATGCEALVEIFSEDGRIQKTLPLHWADTPYNALSTSIERVIISRLPRRLDVVFTQEKQSISGCCIASAQALATGPQRDQFFLSDGDYKIKIHINYNSGKSVKREFIIKSPDTWENLEMKTV